MLKKSELILKDTLNRIDDIMVGKYSRLKTGSEFIDKFTDGLEEGSLNILAARPGNGKTSFIIDLINSIKEKVAFYSLEMNEWEIGRKMISRASNINSQSFFDKSFINSQYTNITKYASMALKENLFINCETNVTPEMVEKQCLRQDFKLIIVDYLQIMKLGHKAESKAVEIGKISQELKSIAKRLNVPIIALSQLNRAGDSRVDKIPSISDLRWAGEIEENAHKIIFLHYPYKYDKSQPSKKILILMPKNRSGESDVYREFYVDYSTSTFRSWTNEDQKNAFSERSSL